MPSGIVNPGGLAGRGLPAVVPEDRRVEMSRYLVAGHVSWT